MKKSNSNTEKFTRKFYPAFKFNIVQLIVIIGVLCFIIYAISHIQSSLDNVLMSGLFPNTSPSIDADFSKAFPGKQKIEYQRPFATNPKKVVMGKAKLSYGDKLATDTALPSSAHAVSAASITELKSDTEYSLGQYNITVSYISTSSDSIIKITAGGATNYINGLYPAYGVTLRTGVSGIIINSVESESQVDSLITTYLLCADGSLTVASRYSNMSVCGKKNAVLIIHEPKDCFGTWTLERKYRLTQDLRLEPVTDKASVIWGDADDLRVIHDITANSTNGKLMLLKTDSYVRIKSITLSDKCIALLTDERGDEYLVERIEKPSGYYVLTPDGLLSERMCFDNMPYHG